MSGDVVNPKIAFFNGDTWSVIGLYHRAYGLCAAVMMPVVDCPVIDTTAIGEDDRMGAIIRKYIKPGSVDVVDLVRELEAIGGRVLLPSPISVAETVIHV